MIVILLASVATEAIEVAEQVATDADGVDRYVGRPGIGMAAGAVAMLAASGGVGAILLLGAGVTGMVAGGFGANILRKRSNRLRAFGARLQVLVGDLKDV